jgi:DNA polymerase
MNREIRGLLREVSKILHFHKSLGIEDYPATEAFAEKRANPLTTMQQTRIGADSSTVIPPKEIKKPQKQNLPDIRTDLDNCKQCGRHNSRTNIIFGEGNSKANLMIIGPSPSIEADREKSLYADEPGKLLMNMLNAINLTPEDVYYTTLVKCKTGGNLGPAQVEIRSCLRFLVRQIEAIAPKIIWTIGTEATQTLLRSNKSLFHLRGQFHEYNGIPLMATFHPEALLQNKELKKPTWTDMQMIQKKLVTLQKEGKVKIRG